MSDDPIANIGGRILNCQEVENLLDRYLDGELDRAVLTSFEHHLAHCESCNSLVSDCSQIVRVAKTLACQPVPPGVSARLRQRLRLEGCLDSAGTPLRLLDKD